MSTEEVSRRRPFQYGVGSVVTFVLSIGLVAIVYGGAIIPFNPFNLPAWVFGPLGIYTIAYSFLAKKDPLYYLVWGIVMVAVAFASAFYNVINVLVIFGVLMVVLAVIGLLAYWRKRG